MNPKQIFGLAGGFLLVYIVITLTNKPQVPSERDHLERDGGPSSEMAQPPAQPERGGGAAIGYCLPGVGAETLASAETDAQLRAMAGRGNWVAISPALFQPDAYASEVTADSSQTPSEESLKHAIAQCRSLGMRVLLRPVVVAKDGTRRERFVPADPSAWFTSYAKAISPWVDLAEREHVEVLSIGANYAQLEKDQPWGELIRQVRERYKGQLTYGAGLQPESGNGGYQQIGFWPALDVVGLEAPLPASGGWSQVEIDLDGWMQANQPGRQAIFTSAGYSAAGPDRQSFEAFKSLLGSKPWLAGANWYQWDPALETDRGSLETDRPAADAPPVDGDGPHDNDTSRLNQ
jgi:hypothetical protein